MPGPLDDRCPACDAQLELDMALADGGTFRCATCSCVFDLAPAPVPADGEAMALLAA